MNKIIATIDDNGYIEVSGIKTKLYYEGDSNRMEGYIRYNNRLKGEVLGIQILGGNDIYGTVKNTKIDIDDDLIAETKDEQLKNAMHFIDGKNFNSDNLNEICIPVENEQ